MKLKIQSIRDFFKSKEKKGLKPIFFESIGYQNTSRDERLKNLIKILEKNGFKRVGDEEVFSISRQENVLSVNYEFC